MNASVRSIAAMDATSRRGPALSVTLGGMRGWVHLASSRYGVLMVGAQGFEAFCAYQSWRVFADLCAGCGLTAVRFDLPGEGDSSGDPTNPSQVAAWIASIQSWFRWMQLELGLVDVRVVGLRLGGLLAASALKDHEEVRRLALLAPPVSGRSYGRELRIAALLAGETKPGSGVDASGTSLCGHFQSVQTLRDIEALGDWRLTPGRAQMLVATPPETDASSIIAPLRSTGSAITTQRFDGLRDMLVGPTASRTPWDAFEQAAGWLAEGAGVESMTSPALSFRKTFARQVGAQPLAGEGYSETAHTFGRFRHLSGILCRPAIQRSEALPVLFLNSGANPHVGWARSHVDQARALAQEGIVSFRMDASGIGDSVWFRTGPRPLLYSQAHEADVIDAVDMLAALGAGGPVVVGLCAGAYLAISTLHADRRVPHAIAVNPLRFVWRESDDLDTAEKAILQGAATYVAKARSPTEWRRLLAGEISPGKLMAAAGLLSRSLARRTLVPVSEALGLTMHVSRDTCAVRERIAAIAARGARLDLVYSERDAGREELERRFGPGAGRLKAMEGVTVSLLEGSDHEVTPRAARDRVLDLVRRAALYKA